MIEISMRAKNLLEEKYNTTAIKYDIDIVNTMKYLSVLKTRLKKESNELTTNCSQLKMQSSDGKMYLTDVSNTEGSTSRGISKCDTTKTIFTR